ncbi:Pre-mRNA-splicing factor CWC22 [Hypsizygus marmoreus]|uniref:Pre-mRNA-splicing factor CWC22 n=1 Tax=Hypsizygus marmoreus TaxID=39966 RepID=A0A369JRV1_HYPMA|nr:Pre-mRNA-splicing factor CWC22 [Hypsizygus marmoreus]
MSAAVMNVPLNADGVQNKRKRSNSPSAKDTDGPPPPTRRRSNSPPSKVLVDLPKVNDVDPVRRAERERQLAVRVAAMELEKAEKPKEEKPFDAQAEFSKLVGSKSGGVYMPPARLRALQQAASSDKTSPEYQRLSWDALRKSITGIVNRVNIVNIKQVVPELFAENLIRGRGLFARSVMKAQAASLPFTPVFAALVAIINTKLPQVGELVLTRLISQFRRSFKRNDKIVCHSTTTFIAHLVNQSVAHEIVALQILMLLLEHPTDDSIEIAVGFMREVGAFLAENSPKANTIVFERFRAVLNEGNISQRVQYMIEVLMQVRKDKFKDNPILPEGLDLVDEDEQITHQIQLEEELQVQEGLNVFKFDPNYLENEEKYKAIKNEILGEESEEESGSEESSDEEEEEVVESKEGIEDRTETNLVNLRRIIYLTIMNALNYEEAVHKLLKVQIQEGQEIELVNMIIECCSQERSYSTFYGLVSERFCKLNRVWTESFETAFRNYYTTIHRYETNRLRNIARLFGHLFATDAISWMVLDCVKINEDDTTSSSRIFIKIMMNEMMESMGLKTLAERFKDPEVKRGCEGMFPLDVPKNTRFAINYFTSIGLGVVTEEMREYLKNAPRLIMEQRRAMLEAESSSSSDSDSSSSDSESSDSDSSSSSDAESDVSSPRHRRRRSPSPSRSRSRTPPRRVRGRDDARSPPPPPPRRDARPSRSPPPPPGRRRSPSPPPRPRHDRPRDVSRDREFERRRASPPPPLRSLPLRNERRAPPASARPRERERSPPPHLGRSVVSGRREGERERIVVREKVEVRERVEVRRGVESDRSMGRGGGYRGQERDRERSPPPRRRDSRDRDRERRRDSRERDEGYTRRR